MKMYQCFNSFTISIRGMTQKV